MKKIKVLLAVLMTVIALTGCTTEADKVSQNLSLEADNFNVVRQLTVINCVQGDTLFQMTGKMSIKADSTDNQLEIVVEDENGNYQKHFIGLSDNVSYVVEQKEYKNVSKYKYTLNYNPKMWIPIDVKTIE
jgi:outer membrane lipoprotein-sorting protein